MGTASVRIQARLLFGLALFLTPVCLIAEGQDQHTAQLKSAPSEVKTNVETADNAVRNFRMHVLDLFYQEEYSELESIASRLQSQQTRFRGGAWQLHDFYSLVSYAGSPTATDAEWQAQIAKLAQWEKSFPESPVPRVAMALTYLGFAWKARGSGYANSVTAEGWELYRQRAQSARQVLEDAAKMGVNCPEWYLTMHGVALAQGWTRSQVDTLVDAALAHEPGYYYIATAHANYLLPKWHGKAGETEQFAEQVANRTGGDEGNIEYFQIAFSINCCNGAQAPALTWSRVKQGFVALDRQYGINNRQLNAMAFLALRAGDKEAAQALFQRIGSNWDQSVWRSKVRFDASRTGQPIAGNEPVGPESPAADGSDDIK